MKPNKKAATGIAAGAPRLKFEQRLVLNQWLLDLFEVESFGKLTKLLNSPELEGFDAENVSRFHYALTERVLEHERLPRELLLGYDANIVRHWRAITEARNRASGRPLVLKYFQYLALLFTEIYLDRWFRDPAALLAELNGRLREFNAESAPGEKDRLPEYAPEDLNKLAFWMATGSGKTLLMHVNILQYRHYLEKNGRGRELNRIILLTPNEGLTRQHHAEFALSGIAAEPFQKDGRGLYAGKWVEILDIHKLRDTMGEKTVAIEAFEGNNLVLVDEGHRGARSEEGQWMRMRNRLCERGFSCEYSATFGQAMANAGDALKAEYARCILFDYSYKYFYRDGYGKDYHILNLKDDGAMGAAVQEDLRTLYLTACLLVYYQQLRLYRDDPGAWRPYQIEKPLWVFVGGSVNAVRTENRRQVSDVVEILLHLAEFAKRRETAIGRLRKLLEGTAGLLDNQGRDIFANAFDCLITAGVTPDRAAELYADIIATVFQAPGGNPAALHVELLKGADGEVALRLGNNTEPFGVINVGDAPRLCELCRAQAQDALVVAEREFSGSLFHGLGGVESTINLLIGSKKFTEGWNSWRVSTMGLMNIGRGEGSEIIQLFGRGVRLKGMGYSLKRTRHLPGVQHPPFVEKLETLNIFGIRADYMQQFKNYLADEGLQANEERLEFVLPVIKNLDGKKLQVIRLKEGLDFKRDGDRPVLKPLAVSELRQPVALDWYPKIQSLASGRGGGAAEAAKHEGRLTSHHLAFLDQRAIWFELQEYKNDRAWFNLNLEPEAVDRLLAEPDWYRLLIPPAELEFTGFDRVRVWQEIAVALLKKYCDRYYAFRKSEWEWPHLECRELTPDDPNFIPEYRVRVEQSQTAIIESLRQVEAMLKRKELKDYACGKLEVIACGQHLYEPLLCLDGTDGLVEVRPVPLNEGERDFVCGLRDYCRGAPAELKGKELYVLRNLSRGRGIGFFEAGNFYPDFVVWLLAGDRQQILFVDPKGLRNLHGPDDPKIAFHRTVKELERRLARPGLTLDSCILSETPHHQIAWWKGDDGRLMTERDFNARHVFFKAGGDSGTVVRQALGILGLKGGGDCAGMGAA
ncbi:MAG: DEAD/DEAH box helicase family protein [Lentisphaeria bacterium]|jgi:hypothetical protein